MADLEYFATKSQLELIPELEAKLKDFDQYLDTSGFKKKWSKSLRMYYGNHFSDINAAHGLKSAGKDGELTALAVNHFRNLIKHILVMTTSQKMAFDVRAVNSDPESLNQSKLGTSILEYYLKEKRLNRYVKAAVEQALVIGKGYIYSTWDKSSGRPYSVEDYQDGEEQKQRVVYDGDIKISNPDPMHVAYDPKVREWSQNEWLIVTEFENKYNLAAENMELKDRILEAAESVRETYETDQTDSNLIPVYYFYHKRTAAMPNGRFTKYLNDDAVFYDGPIPYDDLPVHRVVPGEIWGTQEGYADSFDLIGIQEAYNMLVSTVLSNQAAFGIQSILVPNGCQITVENLTDNLQFLKYNPQMGKPEALQLTASPPEIFKMIDMLERISETISGVNSVARGNPEASLKSGVALSLVQSMAVQYASGIQESYAELFEDLGTFILKLLKSFAKTERMIAIAGKQNRNMMASFTGDKISNVDRVVIDLGNPMSRTLAGRSEMADNLLGKGLIKTPQEYITVITTGQLEPAYKSTESELTLIHEENDDLLSGKPVTAIMFDAHLLHLQEHKSILSNPEIRQNQQALASAMKHIQEHITLYKEQDPLFAQINGEAPSPAPMGPPPGPQGPPPQESQQQPPPPMNQPQQ